MSRLFGVCCLDVNTYNMVTLEQCVCLLVLNLRVRWVSDDGRPMSFLPLASAFY